MSARAHGRNFAAERAEPGANVFEAVTQARAGAAGRAASAWSIALWSEGARERMSHVLADHGLHNLTPVAILAAGAGAAEAAGRARRARPRIRLRDRRRRRHQRAGHPRRPAGAAAPRRQARGEFHRRGDEPRAPAISSCMSITASAASSACRRSRRPARRTTAWRSTTPAATSCSCRSRTSSCCRATARRRPTSSSTGSAAAAGRRARRGMKSRIREIAGELIKIAAERQLREAPRLDGRAGRLRRILRRLPLRGDRGPAGRHRRDARRSRHRPADGPADLRRRRLRQDRGGAARRLRRRDERQAGRGGGADDAAGAPALQDLHRALPRLPGEGRRRPRGWCRRRSWPR